MPINERVKRREVGVSGENEMCKRLKWVEFWFNSVQ